MIALEFSAGPYADHATLTELTSRGELRWMDSGAGDQVLALATELMQDSRPVGVGVFRGAWVTAAGILADRLEVPAVGLRASRASQDKALQRFLLEDESPRYVALTGGARGQWRRWREFPAVLKPVDRSGSSGVLRIGDRHELAAGLTTFPPEETVLIEELVAGTEFSVESLVQGGRVIFSGLTEKRLSNDPARPFVEAAHTVVGPDDPTDRTELLDTNARVLRRLDVRDGMIHAEYRVRSGRAYLIEINARPGGGSIPAAYGFATGSSLEDALIAICVGIETEYPTPKRWARQVYAPHPPGELIDVELDWPDVTPNWLAEQSSMVPTPKAIGPIHAEDPPTLRTVTVSVARRTRLGTLHSNDDRAVSYVIDAATRSELDELEKHVDWALRIVTRPDAADGPNEPVP